jgi:hypothetical protein
MEKFVKAAVAVLICVAGLAFNLLSFDSFLFFGLPLITGVAAAVVGTVRSSKFGTIDQVVAILRVYMGGHLLWSCLRYWSTNSQPVIHHPLGGPFVASLVAIGAFPMIKTLEGICGVLLLSNRFVPLALVLAVPTSLTIFYLNTFVTARLSGILTGPPELGVNVALLLAYFQHYRTMLVEKASVAPPASLSKNRA